MNFQNESIKNLKSKSKTNQSQNFDWDIIVPDSKPDIKSIITTDGVVSITGKEIMQDRAVINGNVKLTILYVSSTEPECVKSIENIKSFNYVLELQDLRQNMILNLYTDIVKISSEILNSRKINVACMLEFFATAYNEEETDFISKIEEDDIKFYTKEISTLKLIDCFEKKISLNENIEVPSGKMSITEILKIKPELSNKEFKLMNNKFALRTNLEFLTMYRSGDDLEEIECINLGIPVNEIIDCDCIKEDLLSDFDVEVCNLNYILKENSDNEKRIIQVCCDLLVCGKIYEMMTIRPIVDAYSLTNNLKLEKAPYDYDLILCDTSGQFSTKDSFTLKSKGDIQKILFLDIKPEIKKLTNINQIAGIKGDIHVTVLYMSTDNKMYFEKAMLNMEQNIPLNDKTENSVCDLKLLLDSHSYNILSDNVIELRINFNYRITAKKSISQEIIKNIDIEEASGQSMGQGIKVFFCSGDEKLWDIAKKYKTTVDDILIVNNMENCNEVKKGMKLLIP
ncbi:MAG: DUF3794 domain-containing protein [Clostridia bacterium]|nr:DUF3794 domain-containing protein [Oscillospiraceae bacterium]MBR4893294.1 DUF3794 domain-containing protein [Clostridia bacterium]